MQSVTACLREGSDHSIIESGLSKQALSLPALYRLNVCRVLYYLLFVGFWLRMRVQLYQHAFELRPAV
jgi:hypothetical protein